MSPTHPIELLRAEAGAPEVFALAAALPDAKDSAPEWITLFPKVGRVETRDSRVFEIDGAALIAAFQADGLELPVDVNHATDLAGVMGGRSDAVGWIAELRQQGTALQGRVTWLDEGTALLRSRKYRYVSPSFYRDDLNKATRLRAVALVTSPALSGQPALASARHVVETLGLCTIALELGLPATADAAACLAAVSTLKADHVPKAVHAATIERLAAVSTEMAALRADVRAKRIAVLLEDGLKSKRIVPAEREHFAGLCATDEGLATVERLFASMSPVLRGSGLGERQPELQDQPTDPARLIGLARKVQDDARAEGRSLGWSEAMMLVVDGRAR